MSEMTAIRTLRFWVIGALAAGWLVAAALLWQTTVPDLDLVQLDPGQAFSREQLERSARYETFHRANWALATLAQLGVLVAIVWVAPRFRVRGLVGGIALGVGALIASWAARLPFVLAAQWWRRRYGVSDAGYGTILVDPWLERIGGLLAAAGAIGLLMLLARRMGDRWWIVGGPAFALVGSLFLLAQPLLLAPRLQPLRDRSVVADVRQLAREQGVGEVDVQVRDASRRTRAINAEFYGVGPTKRVVIWDTALEQLSRRELKVLISHEFGHVEAHHVWKSVGWLFLFAVPGAYVVARVTRRRGGLAEPAAVPLALLTVAVLQLALLPGSGAISRRYEREADWLALRTTRDPAAFEDLAKKLAAAALADPDPPRWARVVLGTHPTPMDRIRLARSLILPRGEGPQAGS
jgi:STE24 endopeptidase